LSTLEARKPGIDWSAKARGPVMFFVGGGSGGHILPGLAVAGQVMSLSPSGKSPLIVFVTSDRAIDAKIMDTMQLPVEVSPARPMSARPSGLWKFLRGWYAARKQAIELLSGDAYPIKDGVEVIAMGGFVAAPFVSAAKSLGVKVTMVNLDAVPGKANKYIARHADRIFTASRVAPEHRRGREWGEVPPIVRGGIRTTMSREECRKQLELDPIRPVLMITGGSQGLRSLNDFITSFVQSKEGQQVLREGGWQIIHQTGRGFAGAVGEIYIGQMMTGQTVEFTDKMGLWWNAADLAVCTAGAGTIAEIWINRVPSLLMPYPHHKDEHQKHNAAPLVECGGAVLGQDWIDPARNVAENGPLLRALLSDTPRRAAMRANLEKLGPADGAERIAKALLGR
jgi:UDP-N-acetylglucosamine--N-acetylmuramyl-(pentapeptide) pyrophosphoryl-undecaprenol N-acetylglucosamine transferase